jgi:hypothetical protein
MGRVQMLVPRSATWRCRHSKCVEPCPMRFGSDDSAATPESCVRRCARTLRPRSMPTAPSPIGRISVLAHQSVDIDKIQAAVEAMLAAGYKAPYIKSTLQGEQGDQRMFKQLPQTEPGQPGRIRPLFPALRQERDDQAMVYGTSAGPAGAMRLRLCLTVMG